MTTEVVRSSEGNAPIDTFYHPALERPQGIANIQEIIARGRFTNEDMFKAVADITNILKIEEDKTDTGILGVLDDDPNFPFDISEASWEQSHALYADYLGGLRDFEVGLDRMVESEEGPREETAWILFEDEIQIDGDEWASRFTQYDFQRNEHGNVSLVVWERISRDGDGEEDAEGKDVTRTKGLELDERNQIVNGLLNYLQTAPVGN